MRTVRDLFGTKPSGSRSRELQTDIGSGASRCLGSLILIVFGRCHDRILCLVRDVVDHYHLRDYRGSRSLFLRLSFGLHDGGDGRLALVASLLNIFQHALEVIRYAVIYRIKVHDGVG